MAASFPVEHTDGIMLVTNGGKLIRIGVDDIRRSGRKTQGVTLVRTALDEQVVSAARLADVGGTGDEADEPDLPPGEGEGDGGED